MMELISECAIRFIGVQSDIYRALTDSACLPLEEQADARRAVGDNMLRLPWAFSISMTQGAEPVGGAKISTKLAGSCGPCAEPPR
jgi:hypothetical protein